MGVRTTNKNAGPTGKDSTQWMDGHCDKFYNSEFDRGEVYQTPQPRQNNFGDGSDGALNT